MKRVALGNMPAGQGVTTDQQISWLRDAIIRIGLASKRDDDLNSLTARVVTLEGAGGGTGDVVGPASAADGEPAVYNGTTGKLIKDITFAAFKTLLVLVKGDVGLGSVDNTSDVNKPVSTAQQAALDLKAPLASPALTGSPTAPTATAGNASTLIATTAFVAAAFDSPELTGIPTSPTLDVGDDSDAIATTAFVHKVLDNQATFDPWQVATVPADSYRWGQV